MREASRSMQNRVYKTHIIIVLVADDRFAHICIHWIGLDQDGVCGFAKEFIAGLPDKANDGPCAFVCRIEAGDASMSRKRDHCPFGMCTITSTNM